MPFHHCHHLAGDFHDYTVVKVDGVTLKGGLVRGQ